MLKQLFELFRSFLLLSHDVQQHRQQIEVLRRDLDKLGDRVTQLALLFQQERYEREKMALQLENTLLRFERRLPPGKPPKERD